MRAIVVAISLACVFHWGCAIAQSNDGQTPAEQGTSNDTSENNRYSILKFLWPVMRSQRLPVFISYAGLCAANDGVQVPFPAVDVRPPSRGHTGIEAIRDIFSKNDDVKVYEMRSGLIKINIGKAPDALLNTRISTLILDRFERYDPRLAVVKLNYNADVRVAERKLGIDNGKWVSVFSILSSGPLRSWPHLPPVLRRITLRSALERLAEKFRGAAIYGACPSGTRTFIDFEIVSDYGGTKVLGP